jgi:hypothetical protein
MRRPNSPLAARGTRQSTVTVLQRPQASYCEESSPPQKSNAGQALQIDDDVADWLSAANEKVAVSRLSSGLAFFMIVIAIILWMKRIQKQGGQL